MKIIPISNTDTIFPQAVAMLKTSFPLSDEWQTLEGATEELNNILEEGVLFGAVEDETLIGMVGALRVYNGYVWELHPLAVDKAYQRRGLGRQLIAHLEDAARREGVVTIMLGTDDEDFRTSLSHVDNLYVDTWQHIANIHQINPENPHPYEFYQKCGYSIVGILPDANGRNKPDIFMAKRL